MMYRIAAGDNLGASIIGKQAEGKVEAIHTDDVTHVACYTASP
jgi:catabolite regulation protein CreA